MSTARGAKLKAQYNRVRTSTALRGNDMWTNTIGIEQDPQAGSNAAVEAQIYAPSHGGSKRAEKRELAQQLIQASGYQPAVMDYKGLLSLGKAQGSLGEGSRGACRRCGGMGHLTKQCTNFLTGHTAAAGIAQVQGVGASSAQAGALGLLPDPGEFSGLSDFSSSSGSSSEESDSDSDSSGSDKRGRDRKKDSKKRKREKKDKKSKDKKQKREGEKESKKRSKKESKRSHKKKKSKKSSKD